MSSSSPSSQPDIAPRPVYALIMAIPIAILGGLIGLGGAEFRLPVLAGPLGYPARRAVPLNLAVSLITIVASLFIRSRTLALDTLPPFFPAMAALIAGAALTAFLGATVSTRLSNHQLERIILVLLVVLGAILIAEAFIPHDTSALLPPTLGWWISAGFGFGLVIGLVSSVLGVAGGELIIPTLVLAFGADIKTAGTASLFISLPTVLIGIARYAHRGAYTDRRALTGTIFPMGIGSIVGAILGGLLVGWVPIVALHIGLGIILIVSALRIFWQQHPQPAAINREGTR